MKKFEINRKYFDKSYYDGDESTHILRLLKRTAKTATFEHTKPGGRIEIETYRIKDDGISEYVMPKYGYLIFLAKNEIIEE